jgi:hypothetical protein
MKKILIISISLLFIPFLSCTRKISTTPPKKDVGYHSPIFLKPIEVEIDFTLESYEPLSYAINWKDTLGMGEGYKKHNRPFELHCVVRDSKGVVGYYRGLSTQFSFCYFSTKDSIIQVFFAKRFNNFFSYNRFSKNEQDTINNQEVDSSQIQIIISDKTMRSVDRVLPINVNEPYQEYAPIRINLNDNRSDLHNNQPVKFLLEANKDLVILHYTEAGGNPDPLYQTIGPPPVLSLSRYFLHPKTGQIKTGKQWINKLGEMDCSFIDFRVVDPQQQYFNNFQINLIGKKLIQDGKIDVNYYDLNQFKSLWEAFPY